MIPRRTFLALPALLAAPALAKDSFRFVHFTDTHIQPELSAAEHTARCVDVINAANADFAIAGGDLVFDVNLVGRPRATQLIALYQRTTSKLRMPVYNMIGNHDLFGIGDRGLAGSQLARQAQRDWETEFGPRMRTFNYKGWHFVTLDSIDVLPKGGYRGWIGPDQLSWLRGVLAGIPAGAPVVAISHIPLVTAFLQYGDLRGSIPDNGLVVENAREVVNLLLKHNVKAVLQGHIHICEKVEYKDCQFITTGAVCGDWWKGPRLGFPNGFTVATVSPRAIQFEYVAY
jgi:3',5'-cyclic AMP phosphodiesterase CpdA